MKKHWFTGTKLFLRLQYRQYLNFWLSGLCSIVKWCIMYCNHCSKVLLTVAHWKKNYVIESVVFILSFRIYYICSSLFCMQSDLENRKCVDFTIGHLIKCRSSGTSSLEMTPVTQKPEIMLVIKLNLCIIFDKDITVIKVIY